MSGTTNETASGGIKTGDQGSVRAAHTPGPWLYTRVVGELSFWSRLPLDHEIDGLDPLTGLIIAYSPDECVRLDSAAIAKAEGKS